jgi:hypothetical protein
MTHHEVSDMMTAEVAKVAEDTPFKELTKITADRGPGALHEGVDRLGPSAEPGRRRFWPRAAPRRESGPWMRMASPVAGFS